MKSTPQRQRRIRQLNARRATLTADLRAIEAELHPLETEESWSRGYRCVQRGKSLLDIMDREDSREGVARG